MHLSDIKKNIFLIFLMRDINEVKNQNGEQVDWNDEN